VVNPCSYREIHLLYLYKRGVLNARKATNLGYAMLPHTAQIRGKNCKPSMDD